MGRSLAKTAGGVNREIGLTCPHATVKRILIALVKREYRLEALARYLPHGAFVGVGIAVGGDEPIHELK